MGVRLSNQSPCISNRESMDDIDCVVRGGLPIMLVEYSFYTESSTSASDIIGINFV